MCVQAKRLAGHKPAWNALMHGLVQPIMDDNSVAQHLKVQMVVHCCRGCRLLLCRFWTRV